MKDRHVIVHTAAIAARAATLIITLTAFMGVLALPSEVRAAEGYYWTWMGGSNSINQSGTHGEKGSPHPDNIPGARSFSHSWTDADGAFWLFGGQGRDTDGNFGHLNDLWKYDPATDHWTWVHGSELRQQVPVYGEMNVPSEDNVPGARWEGVSWTGADGTFWLFGGEGESSAGMGRLNDLWRYNPATNQWTWMKGATIANQNGVYGDIGVEAEGNTPGTRELSVAWTGHDGNLWLFGGFGLPAGGATFVRLNDLWRFNPQTGNWTWIKGSSGGNQAGIYGSIGVEAPGNTPGGHSTGVSWVHNDGTLWHFGGFGFGATVSGRLNDLWRYNTSTNNWAWMGGSNATNQAGTYGTMGEPAPGNIPGARISATEWTDSDGAMWLSSGFGNASAGSGRLNDLWRYDPTSDEWTWMRGSSGHSQNGAYGTMGVPALANTPGSRLRPVSWTDGNDALWLFGGNGRGASGTSEGVLNDLWRFAFHYSIQFTTDGTPGATITGETSQLVARNEDATEVAANAPDEHTFVRWTEDGETNSTDNPLIITTVTASLSLVAEFAPDTDAQSDMFVIFGD